MNISTFFPTPVPAPASVPVVTPLDQIPVSGSAVPTLSVKNISNFFPTPAPEPVVTPPVYIPVAQTNFIPVSGSAVSPSLDLSSLLSNAKLQIGNGTGELSKKANLTTLSPGNIQALSPSLYYIILTNVLLDIATRYNLTIDPTKLTYKMIQGQDTPLPVSTTGIEISTMTSSDFFHLRVYIVFGQQTSLRFISRLQEQNYDSSDLNLSTIYLYEATVNKIDFPNDYAMTFLTSFQNNIPCYRSALLTETGTPLTYLSEEGIPLALEF